MNPVALHLRRASAPETTGRRAFGAVFVPGADPRLWLAEAAAWPEPLSRNVRFYVVPVSRTDPRPGGALLVPGAGSGQTVEASVRALPCDAVVAGLWVPRGAVLVPAISAEEARRLLLFPVNFFHPAVGLIGWETVDGLAPSQLLRLPKQTRGASWEMASAGPAPGPRLQSVHLNLDDADLSFLENVGSDIGDKSRSDFAATRTAGERLQDALEDALGRGQGLLGSMLGAGNAAPDGQGRAGQASGAGSGAASGSGNGASRSGFLRFLQAWAAQQTKALQDRRDRELERLMKLLETNPAEGLRFALPLAGERGARGFAGQAGDRLTLRNPSLGGLGSGGGVADVWDLNADWRWKLQQRYREIAAEEIRRGRFERAAYIYGELLGEWRLAAEALMQGGLFREAARLHLRKTNDHAAAAECLEKAGLLVEAIEHYVAIGMHERCGDLYARMGMRTEAFRSYLLAIRAGGTRLVAARILTEKLSHPGWAAAVLASGWPRSNEAIPCFTAHFALMTRCQAEEECGVQTERLAQQAEFFLQSVEAIRAVALAGRGLPFARCRERIAVICRLAIARAAQSADANTARKFIECLSEVEPDDPLLQTDIRRFVTKKVDPVPMPVRTRLEKPLAPSKVLALPPLHRWIAMTRYQDSWVALGQARARTVILVGGSSEAILPPQSIGASDVRAAWFIEDGHHLGGTGLVLHPELPWESRTLTGPGYAGEIRVAQVTAAGSGQTLAVASSQPGNYSAIVRGESDGVLLSLATYVRGGRCVRTRPLGWAEVPAEVSSLPFACIGERAFVALGNQLYMLEDKDGAGDPKLSGVNLPGLITGLAVTRPGKRIRVAVAWDHEVVLLSPEEKWEPAQLELCEAAAPALCYLPDGNLVIASSREAKVVRVEGRIETLATLRFSAPSAQSAVAVVPLDVSTCAVLLAEGRVEVFRVEG